MGDEAQSKPTDNGSEQGPAGESGQDRAMPPHWRQPIDENIDADVDSRPDSVSRAELRHPHEKIDAKLLCPGQPNGQEKEVDGAQRLREPGESLLPRPDDKPAEMRQRIAMDDRGENHECRRTHQTSDQVFLKPV